MQRAVLRVLRQISLQALLPPSVALTNILNLMVLLCFVLSFKIVACFSFNLNGSFLFCCNKLFKFHDFYILIKYLLSLSVVFPYYLV